MTSPAEQEALVAAYALGALTAEEGDEAERLMAGEPALRRVFDEALETAALLAVATADATPPPELRERILAAARRERDGS